jgi:hypothetical protein
MKKTIIIVLIALVIIVGLFFLKPSFFNFLQQKISSETVSMSLEDFKKMCSDTNGEYKDEIFFGAVADRRITCGYNKASDADQLCKSENKMDSCVFCKYGSSCGPAAGDFGPEHCRCLSYKSIKYLSAKDIPNIGE